VPAVAAAAAAATHQVTVGARVVSNRVRAFGKTTVSVPVTVSVETLVLTRHV